MSSSFLICFALEAVIDRNSFQEPSSCIFSRILRHDIRPADKALKRLDILREIVVWVDNEQQVASLMLINVVVVGFL